MPAPQSTTNIPLITNIPVTTKETPNDYSLEAYACRMEVAKNQVRNKTKPTGKPTSKKTHPKAKPKAADTTIITAAKATVDRCHQQLETVRGREGQEEAVKIATVAYSMALQGLAAAEESAAVVELALALAAKERPKNQGISLRQDHVTNTINQLKRALETINQLKRALEGPFDSETENERKRLLSALTQAEEEHLTNVPLLAAHNRVMALGVHVESILLGALLDKVSNMSIEEVKKAIRQAVQRVVPIVDQQLSLALVPVPGATVKDEISKEAFKNALEVVRFIRKTRQAGPGCVTRHFNAWHLATVQCAEPEPEPKPEPELEPEKQGICEARRQQYERILAPDKSSWLASQNGYTDQDAAQVFATVVSSVESPGSFAADPPADVSKEPDVKNVAPEAPAVAPGVSFESLSPKPAQGAKCRKRAEQYERRFNQNPSWRSTTTKPSATSPPGTPKTANSAAMSPDSPAQMIKRSRTNPSPDKGVWIIATESEHSTPEGTVEPFV